MKLTSVFYRNYASDAILTIHRGGTGSSKTRSMLQDAGLWLFSGTVDAKKHFQSGEFTIVRKVHSQVKELFEETQMVIEEMGLLSLVDINRTDLRISYLKRELKFLHVDHFQKVRSAKRALMYCCEVNALSPREFSELDLRTDFKVMVDFNPELLSDWVNRLLEKQREEVKKDVKTIISTYKDNPFLPRDVVEKIEFLKHSDEFMYKRLGLGEYADPEGLVFHWKIEEEPQIEDPQIIYGLDPGYTDPCALVKITKPKDRQLLYCKQELYEAKLDTELLILKVAALVEPGKICYCDSSRPDIIAALKKAGVRAIPSKKGKGSIIQGITFLQSFEVFMHPKSFDLHREANSYHWAQDAEGNSKDMPIDSYNHCLDSIRYAVEKFRKRGGMRVSYADPESYYLNKGPNSIKLRRA